MERDRRDGGMTIVEVVVAMVVFAIVALGLLTSVTKSLALTRDNRARVVAANLAESEIGIVRATVYDQIVALPPRTQTVGQLTYTVSRSVSSVLAGGTGSACSGGSVTREIYKKVAVKVTFPTMAGTRPVQADTIVRAPDAAVGTTTGAIGATVIDRAGQPVPGVTVAVGAVSGVTDDSGCVYLNGLTPGNLTVTASLLGYVTPAGATSSSSVVGVTAGVISSPQFQLDAATTVSVRVAVLAADGSELPTYTLPRSSSQAGVVPLLDNPDRTTVTRTTLTGPVTGAAATWQVAAYPFGNGYEAHLGACGPGVAVTTPQGGAASVTLGLAPVDVQLAVAPPAVTATLAGRTVQAVAVGACAQTWTGLVATAADGSLKLGLPYGTWRLTVVGDPGSPTVVTLAAGAAPTPVTLGVTT